MRGSLCHSNFDALSLFKSVVVLWREGLNAKAGTAETKDIVRWLRWYDAEFKSGAVGVERLDLLYHRQLSVIANGAEITRLLATEIFPVARELGLATIGYARVQDYAGATAEFEELIGLCRPGSLVLDAEEARFSDCKSVGNTLAHLVLDAGVSLTLVGQAAYWISSGVLASVSFNSKQPSIVFQDEAVNEINSSKLFKSSIGPVSQPCKKRFRLFITSDGLIYPCQALAGMSEFAIGNIRQNGLHFYVSSDKIVDLAKNGPNLSGMDAQRIKAPTNPLVCALHKARLTRANEPIVNLEPV